jgi:antitoxin component YwqK of YwqJK toxin-antitoxin module
MVDAQGHLNDPSKIYEKASNRLLGQGSFIDGQPNGYWELWDKYGTKVAELNYKNGLIDGKYKLYYNEKFGDGLKTIGHAQNGKFVGYFIRYLPNGEPLVSYQTNEQEKIIAVTYGTLPDAEEQLEADKHLIANIYMARIKGKI